VARWRRQDEGQRIEPPEWYRVFHPEAWDEPDSQEQLMIAGCLSMQPWPADLHEWHSRRRWHQAQNAYLKDHPALAEQEFNDIFNGELTARERERRYE
jgi:hypothetical protein